MDQRESDPTGAFSSGGAAGMDEERTELERHTPNGDQADVDVTERDRVTKGTAATSELADPEAQADAERHGGGTPEAR
jgi:hypothetical protein